MGRRNKERVARIKAGQENSIRNQVLYGVYPTETLCRCNVCKSGVPDHLVLDHCKTCWGIKYTQRTDVPETPPFEAFENYRSKHKEST